MPKNWMRAGLGLAVAFVVVTLLSWLLRIPVSGLTGGPLTLEGFGQGLRSIVSFAWPGAIAAILFALSRRVGRVRYWLFAGALIGIAGFLALHRPDAATRADVASISAFLNLILTGAAGGLAYWLIAGRRNESYVLAPDTAANTDADGLGWGALAAGLLIALLPGLLTGSVLPTRAPSALQSANTAPAVTVPGEPVAERNAKDATAPVEAAPMRAAMDDPLPNLSQLLKARGHGWADVRLNDGQLTVAGEAPSSGARLSAFDTVVTAIAPSIGPDRTISFVNNGITLPAALEAAAKAQQAEIDARRIADLQAEMKRKAAEVARAADAAAAKAKAEAEAQARQRAETEAKMRADAEKMQKLLEDLRKAAEDRAQKAADDARKAAEEAAKKDQEKAAAAERETAQSAAIAAQTQTPPAAGTAALAAGSAAGKAVAAFSAQVTPPAASASSSCGLESVRAEAAQPLAFRGTARSLTSDAYPALDRIADLARRCKGLKIIVTGHADSRGSDAYNDRLSKARAAWVRRALHQRGVPHSRIVARGMGSSRPLDTADTVEARALNRRVELNFSPL